MRYKDIHLRLPLPEWGRFRATLKPWVPSRGNFLLVALAFSLLLWTQHADALTGAGSTANTTATIAYQGRLANAQGNPLTSTESMIFRLYSAATGGAPLWEEQWTGSNSVQVSNGLFNVMLGSLTPIPQSVIAGNSNLFLGITVGTDSEMSPRVQLGSVPFAVQALTVPDGSITSAKIADGAITQAKLSDDLGQMPYVPRVLKYISKQDDLWLDSSPTGTGQTIESIEFSLPEPIDGYRWDLEWRFNQRLGAMSGQSVTVGYLLDGIAVKDSSGNPFAENSSLSIQGSPTDNMIMGGMVYQTDVSAGNHLLSWEVAAYGDPSNKFLIRQRWLVLTAILVPIEF